MYGPAWLGSLRKVAVLIIRGAVEDPLAYRVDAVLRQFIAPFRHHFALVSIRRDDLYVEKAGIGASRFHPQKRGKVFLIRSTLNVD